MLLDKLDAFFPHREGGGGETVGLVYVWADNRQADDLAYPCEFFL